MCALATCGRASMSRRRSGARGLSHRASSSQQDGRAGDRVLKVIGLYRSRDQLLLRALPVTSDGGCKLYGGHTMRVSGARWLARSGALVPQIQSFARRPRRYTGEAHIEEIDTLMGPHTHALDSPAVEAISWGERGRPATAASGGRRNQSSTSQARSRRCPRRSTSSRPSTPRRTIKTRPRRSRTPASSG